MAYLRAVLWIYLGFALFAVAYAAMMLTYRHYWRTLSEWQLPDNYQHRTSVTVLVPARNEAAGIEACLRGIAAQNFPKELLQIILLDDHSEDNTAELAAAIPGVEVLRLADFPARTSNSFKKHAISIGIAHARGELIVGTDADCLVPPDWLRLLTSVYETTGAVFIAAPVNFHREQTAFQRFQSLDFAGMIGITGAGMHGDFLHMANGANLAYSKKVFEEIGGFGPELARASGDDMLLLQRFRAHHPERIFFLKNRQATVRTTPMPDWSSFYQQRLRWGTKTGDYQDTGTKLQLGLAWLFCWAVLFAGISTPWIGWEPVAGLLLAKFLVDYLFLASVVRYFGRRDLLRGFPISQFWHLAYILVVGTASIFVQRYEWKGRRVR